jgi:hypothetical protein
LASDHADYITGTSIIIDVGTTLCPALPQEIDKKKVSFN